MTAHEGVEKKRTHRGQPWTSQKENERKVQKSFVVKVRGGTFLSRLSGTGWGTEKRRSEKDPWAGTRLQGKGVTRPPVWDRIVEKVLRVGVFVMDLLRKNQRVESR